MGYDLHTHSIYSDGTLKPAELVDKAVARGLVGIALTDHDSIGGVRQAMEESGKRSFTFIPGVELTTDYGNSEVHVLGYCYDLENPSLNQKLEMIVQARNDRAKLILEKLRQHHLPVSWEKVKAKTTSRFVGRSHIFKALEEEGLIAGEHRRSAFEYYLGKNGVAYVPHREIGTLEAIQLIDRAGGISVLAHPGRMNNDSLIMELINAGLRGIEVYYPTHTPEQTAKYLKMAEKHQLIITGGSDFHGAFNRTKLGDAQVDDISNWFRQ
ncbi:MAG: PHP domain-containing protein [Bacillota bacterium]